MMKMEALLRLGHRKDLRLRLSKPSKLPSFPTIVTCTHVTDSLAFKTIDDDDDDEDEAKETEKVAKHT